MSVEVLDIFRSREGDFIKNVVSILVFEILNYILIFIVLKVLKGRL